MGTKEVARHAGVARGRVSNVLNRPEIVSDGTRRRVLSATNELGDIRNDSARQPVRVPRDVAIVGYDDIDFAAAAAVPLSSVRQPREQLGRTAAELLLEEANDRDHHEHRYVVFSPDLVVRESTARPRRARPRRG